MVATVMRISDDLKNFISSTQQKLKREIYEHHELYIKLKQDPKNGELEKKLKLHQNAIHGIGDDQQLAIHRIKIELKEYGKKLQKNGISHAVIGRATNLNNAIQTAVTRSAKPSSSSTSPIHVRPSTPPIIDVPVEVAGSDDSSDTIPSCHSPEPPNTAVSIDELTQVQFMKYFGVVTNAVHDEMQKKRVERKRRSTANPQFFYGTKWDMPFLQKRKRSTYLLSNISPPHTRQAAKNKAKAERPATPHSKDSSPGTKSPINTQQLPIPKLPVGLTIEPIDPNRGTPDSKLCIVCCLPGGCLSVCESCSNGFHVSCHNRPLVQQPRKCPKCIVDIEVHTIGGLNVPSGMSVSYVPSTDLTEKLHEMHKLLEENKSLTAELIKLQDQHSQLTLSLKEQQLTQQELLVTQHVTEDKIKNLVNCIESVKSTVATPL